MTEPIITLDSLNNLDWSVSGWTPRPKRGFFVREPIVERESSCPHCQASIRYQVEKRVDTRLVAEMVQLAARDTFDAAVCI